MNKASTKKIASNAFMWGSTMLVITIVMVALTFVSADSVNDASTTAPSTNNAHQSVDPNATKVANEEPPIDASKNSWTPRLVPSKWWGILAVVLCVTILYIRNSNVTTAVLSTMPTAMASEEHDTTAMPTSNRDDHTDTTQELKEICVSDDDSNWELYEDGITPQTTDRDATNNTIVEQWLDEACDGDISALETLFNTDIEENINITDKNGYTALMSAALGGQLACMQWLVGQGADVNAMNKWGETASSIALAVSKQKTDPDEKTRYEDCVFYFYGLGTLMYL